MDNLINDKKLKNTLLRIIRNSNDYYGFNLKRYGIKRVKYTAIYKIPNGYIVEMSHKSEYYPNLTVSCYDIYGNKALWYYD